MRIHAHGNVVGTVAGLSALAMVAGGCSFSASSASISDSITGSSNSISDSLSSSSPDGSSKSEQAYREDVRDYTATAARTGRSLGEFRAGLTQVAERHGVTNWEADDATYVAIGEGLRRAGVGTDGVTVWSEELVRGGRADVPADRLIQKGYDASHS